MESLILLICLQVWEGRDADVEKLRSELDRMMDEALKLALATFSLVSISMSFNLFESTHSREIRYLQKATN